MNELSLYSIKTRFVRALGGAISALAARGIPATAVTLASVPVAALAGISIYAGSRVTVIWIATPFLLITLMGLNAIDGALARATNDTTERGAVLNELTDRAADLLLLSSLFFVARIGFVATSLVLVLTVEVVALIGWGSLGDRALVGTMGKPDRALTIGLASVAALFMGPAVFNVAALLISAGTVIAVVQRTRWILAEATRLDRETADVR